MIIFILSPARPGRVKLIHAGERGERRDDFSGSNTDSHTVRSERNSKDESANIVPNRTRMKTFHF